MARELIQLRIEQEITNTVDEIFNKSGINTNAAIIMFLTQVANSGKSPCTNLFVKK